MVAMSAPAFAATSGVTWSAKSIVAGTYTSSPDGFAAMQSGSETTFMPVFYVEQALKALGYSVSWSGSVLSVVTPSGVTPNFSNISVGSGNASIYVNGTLVKQVNTMVEGDPATGGKIKTTYMPIYYIDALLQAAGLNATWTGTGWNIPAPTTTTTTGATLSTPTVSGETIGTGSATSPAINEAAGTITVSTNLTDASGNPIPNVNLNLTLTGGNGIPTVQQGTTFETVSGTASPYTATVTTNASGNATFTVGGLGSYSLEIAAPYNTNGTVVSQTIYVGFVSNSAIMTPSTGYAVTASTNTNSTQGLVPVTVTLPESNSAPQANTEVTFAIGNSATSAGGGTNAFFANASGANISSGSTYTTYTNANGQATVYVNDYSGENVYVNVTQGATASTTPTASTELEYSNPAAPSSSLTGIGVSAFAPTTSYTPTATSLTGVPNGQVAYFVPLNGSAELTGDTETYSISASNGGEISGIDGQSLPSIIGTPSTVQLVLTANSATSYSATVDGVPFTLPTAFASVPYFSVGVTNVTSASGSTLTVSNGSVKSTAGFTGAVSGAYAANFTPTTVQLGQYNGQSQTSTFQVLDASGNPAAGASVKVTIPTNANNLWLTAVNNTALTQYEGTAGSEPTPIPFYTPSPGVTYSTGFSIPTLATWDGGSVVTVFANSQGMVSLTLQAGNVSYWGGSGSLLSSGSTLPNPATSTSVYTYGSGNTGTHSVVYIGSGMPSGWGTSGYQIGSINW